MLYKDSIHTSKYTSMRECKQANINVRYICCIQIQYILVNIQSMWEYKHATNNVRYI